MVKTNQKHKEITQNDEYLVEIQEIMFEDEPDEDLDQTESSWNQTTN
jgi:hypothetical protein